MSRRGREDVDASIKIVSGACGEEFFECRVRHVEVASSRADNEVWFEAPVKVRAPGRDDVVSPCHLHEPSALLGRVSPVIALHSCESGRGELLQDAIKTRCVETERQGMANTATARERAATAMNR